MSFTCWEVIIYSILYCERMGFFLSLSTIADLMDIFCCRYPSDGRHRRDTVPITTRQLEALIRLSQARAKACLREFVMKEDALDVVDLLRKSVEQVRSLGPYPVAIIVRMPLSHSSFPRFTPMSVALLIAYDAVLRAKAIER